MTSDQCPVTSENGLTNSLREARADLASLSYKRGSPQVGEGRLVVKKTFLALALVLSLGALALAGESPATTYHKAYDGKNEAGRLAAVMEVSQIQSRVVVSLLAYPASQDPSAKVRIAAIKALGTQWASGPAAVALGKALHVDDDPGEVTLAIVHALGATQADAAVAPLVRLLKTRPRVYRNGGQNAKDIVDATGPVIDALAKNGSALATGDLIDFLSSEEPGAQLRGRRNRAAAGDPLLKKACAALSVLTGVTYNNAEDWQDWWTANSAHPRVVIVYRCELTGKFYDKPQGKQVCPGCGGAIDKCSLPTRTRYANVPLAEDTAANDK